MEHIAGTSPLSTLDAHPPGLRTHPTSDSDDQYVAAVAQSNYRRLYVHPYELEARHWVNDEHPAVAEQSFVWGTSGWMMRVRASPNGVEYHVVLTLHDELIFYTREITYSEAMVIYRNAEEEVARIVCADLDAEKRYLEPEIESWDSDRYLSALDARWRFQAYTGLHIDIVNALLASEAGYDDLVVIAMASQASRRAALARYFESTLSLEWHWLHRVAVVNSPLAWLATSEEFSRLLAPGSACL